MSTEQQEREAVKTALQDLPARLMAAARKEALDWEDRVAIGQAIAALAAQPQSQAVLKAKFWREAVPDWTVRHGIQNVLTWDQAKSAIDDALKTFACHLSLAPPHVAPEPVGKAERMPGASGFTLACFKADDVSVGTPLYPHPAPQAQAVPDGWKLVPVEATEAMGQAAADYLDAFVKAYGLWEAMLAAAPSAPTQRQVYADWPKATPDDKRDGWELEYRFLERVTDLAATRTEYSTSMEATEQVLIAAIEVLAAAKPERNVWQQVVDEELVGAHIGIAVDGASYEEAKKMLNQLICWHINVTTDPKINGGLSPQPERKPLTDEQIDAIAEGMPGGLDGFLKGWGWRQFARAVLALRAIPEWEPAFDAMEPEQEALAVKFCAEIAGSRGKKGSPPDAVRLLEMAHALYEAERAHTKGIL